MSKPDKAPATKSIILENFWPYKVSVLAHEIRRNTVSILRQHSQINPRHPLNLSQWRVLAAVADHEGRSAAEVVAMTPMDKGIVSRACASLAKNGLIRKQADHDDKRVSTLSLTKDGKTVYLEIATALQNSFSGFTVGLNNGDLLVQIEDFLCALRPPKK